MKWLRLLLGPALIGAALLSLFLSCHAFRNRAFAELGLVGDEIQVQIMAQIERITVQDIVDYFDELKDPRAPINIKHPFVSVVVIAMMGVLAGAGGPTAIAKWANLKADFLLQALDLPHGIPYLDAQARR